jgi:hypothetical protein
VERKSRRQNRARSAYFCLVDNEHSFRRNGLTRWLQILAIPVCLAIAIAAESRGPVPEQSPRKALLEVLLGGDEGLKKHLTLEVQRKIGQTLSDRVPEGIIPAELLNTLNTVDNENIETYEAGPVLLSCQTPAQHQKLEIRIDGEDLRGADDQMRLSLHSFRNGVEEELAPALRFTLSWKAQQNVWRLNAITVSATMPIGDPRVFDKQGWDKAAWDQTRSALPIRGPADSISTRPATPAGDDRPKIAVEPVVEASSSSRQSLGKGQGTSAQNNPPEQPPGKAPESGSQDISPARAIRLIGLAEDIYAQKHPQTGFTCFLSELVNVGRGFEDGEPYRFIDPELAQGVYNGYRFMLTACAGSPVKSFQVVAEPVSGTGRAYCSNPTHQLLGSDDGHAASCLASGKVVQR